MLTNGVATVPPERVENREFGAATQIGAKAEAVLATVGDEPMSSMPLACRVGKARHWRPNREPGDLPFTESSGTAEGLR